MKNMLRHHRLLALAGILTGMVAIAAAFVVEAADRKTDFAERHRAIKARFDKRHGRIENEAVHKPPMIEAQASDLADDEPVIGVSLKNEARAYPLTMMFGGGGIFELLNDTCDGQPIAASW